MSIHKLTSLLGIEGKGLIELAIIVPWMLLMGFYTFDLDVTLESHQKLALISREAANRAFRECGNDSEEDKNTCLSRILPDIQDTANKIMSGVNFSVSIFQCRDENYKCNDNPAGVPSEVLSSYQGETGSCSPDSDNSCWCKCVDNVIDRRFTSTISGDLPIIPTSTHYQEADFQVNEEDTDNILASLIEKHKTVAVAEVYYKQQPLFLFIRDAQERSNGLGLYDATIY